MNNPETADCSAVSFYIFINLTLYIVKAFVYNRDKITRNGGCKMNSKIKNNETDFLFKAILQLESMEECYKFFEDLCTVQEIRAMSQRIAVAKMLSDGKVYSEIVKQTGASTATISRVNRSLEYGCDAYPMIFGRIAAEENAE